MSEHTNADANNLCITEEVFEKFQAESMYEEEELITLSDILPTNGTVEGHSASDDAKDFFADENVTVGDTLTLNSAMDISSQNVQYSEITTGPGNSEDLLVEASDINVCENIEVQAEIVEEKQPKRRGRQKKKTTDETSIRDVDTDVVEKSQPKRSGRRKRCDNDTVKNISVEDQMELIHGDYSDVSNNESIQGKVSSEENIIPNIPKKRGRKKKLVQEHNIDTSIEDNNDNVGKVSEQLDLNSSSQNVQNIIGQGRRRGRKKKTIENNYIDTSLDNNSTPNNSDNKLDIADDKMDENDDLPISAIKNENDYNSDSLHNASIESKKNRACRGSSKKLTEVHSKTNDVTGRKRGRPKKQPQPPPEPDSLQKSENMDKIVSSVLPNVNKVDEPTSTVDKPDSIPEPIAIDEISKFTNENDIDMDDDADNLSLSNLKQVLVTQSSDSFPTSSKEEVITSTIDLVLGDTETLDHSSTKRNTKALNLPEFEYNLENIMNEDEDKTNDNLHVEIKNGDGDEESLLVEDTSRRPKRRKIKQNFHYQEESDEDPFANVELSDDEPKRGKRSGKYYSDDEYIPGSKRGKSETTDTSQSSDMDAEDLQDLKKQKRRRYSKKLDSPKKKSNKHDPQCTLDVTTIPPTSTNTTDDIEVCLESSVIKNTQIDESSDSKSVWGNTNEFENFIAQKIQGTDLKIKKVSSTTSTTAITPLDIPVLDPSTKKFIEKSTQTSTVKNNTQGSQTAPPHDIPMKENVALTKEQSERACDFLNSIVKTTSELGVLMTQKSDDFMKKKIHTDHVTDTFKMDYCVRKSFLLFKLAKHNLMQMEEDLAQQYDEFLKSNNLHTHREEIKTIASTSTQKTEDNDSDCEIVDVKPVSSGSTREKKDVKPKFNPKTVFLNKELSIKIAKKPSDDKKLNIKGRHTVWINDSVILKKVTPTQSFLAQDSRNKKPPDSKIIENIVNDFFKSYEREVATSLCAPFISTDWMTVRKQYVCNYFVESPEIPSGSEHFVNETNSENVSDVNKSICEAKCGTTADLSSPKSLLSLCTLCIQKQQYFKRIPNMGKCEKVILQPQSLSEISLQMLNREKKYLTPSKIEILNSALSLKTICIEKVTEIFNMSTNINNFIIHEEIINEIGVKENIPKTLNTNQENRESVEKNRVKKLFSLCVELIQKIQKKTGQSDSLPSKHNNTDTIIWNDTCDQWCTIEYDKDFIMTHYPKSLKNITHNNIIRLMYNCHGSEWSPKKITPKSSKTICDVRTLSSICLDLIKAKLYDINFAKTIGVTINSINTLSEEAFLNIGETCADQSDPYRYFDEESNCYEDEFEPEYEFEEDINDTVLHDSNWVKQVQMKELKSCLLPNTSNLISENTLNEAMECPTQKTSEIPFMVNIKSEPIEEEVVESLIEPVNVKTEPTQVYNDLTIALEQVTTKTEPENSNAPSNILVRSASYDGDAFEDFVRTNKMIQGIEYTSNEEIFSQSSLRIRRQFDPDSDDENDAGMSLLIPHTYQPLKITEAKDTLMQSSSDENNKDASSKKKIDKRKRKTKKVETKTTNKDVNTVSKNKTVVNNEVAVLTRRMRERIRQEEKKVQSSDSENEARETRSKNDKKRGKTEETPDTCKIKYGDVDIQCNNVDSTEKLDLIVGKSGKEKEPLPDEIFTGFSAVDQTEINTYQKYLKDVYEKILPKIDTNDKNCSNMESPTNNAQDLINPNETVEYLECEPTLPIFEKETRKRSRKKTAETPTKSISKDIIPDTSGVPESRLPDNIPVQIAPSTESMPFVDRHGWQCYPINVNDRKLYDNCQILLDKLPETFVEMYFQYQNITHKSQEDEEVDRLTNLQSLNRTSTVKEFKNKTKLKEKTEQALDSVSRSGNDFEDSRPDSPGSDHYHELTPSEDDGSDREEATAVPIEKPASENNMAKSSLMDDNSDTDTENADGKLKKVKQEPFDSASNKNTLIKAPKRQPGPKSKTKLIEQKHGDHPDLMLTADKMMNKELALLNAPVKLNEIVPELPIKKPSTRGKQKNSSKKEIHYRIKNEDDSSSEEEKQWVTTKEKLLKRLGKKQESTMADEAKRTKIVSEYIERRGEIPEPRLPQRRRGRRSNKKFLERQKQLRVLTRELLGDAADSSHHTKRYNQAYFKGRRNIRKVIDKKSLARSTVMANMEEFERKRRLNMKQARLCELLGCDEGVNVLVINDELCLEYDFEQQQPVVSVHPFFTKIMKAHQYEGVKFMWDACFEGLPQLAAGGAGGGCILAHCMGLGKTLQVLALLHTVLTHPGVGMQRVLVCCPLSTVLNWVDEIHKWIGPVTDQIKVFELSKLKKTYERAYQLEDWYSGGGIFIIGYELFRSLTTLDAYLDDVRPTILKKIRTALLDPGPDIIVCDEGHLLKNDCSVLAVAMSRVMTKRRIVLTGTPMQNNLREYYCMVNFVKPNLLGTYAEYSNRFENPIMNGQHRDSSEEDIKLMKARTHILHKVLEGCLQRQEASVLYPYLPKKHEYTLFISPTKCQWDMYKYYLTHYANKAKNGVLKDFHILQKVWSHPQVLHHFQTKARDVNTNKVKTEKLEDDLAEEDAAPEDIKPNDTDIWWLQFLEGGAMLDSLESSNKFVVVFRILDESIKLGDKVLIFSTSLFTMDTLEFFLRKINKWSLGQEYYRLDGSVPPEVRQKWCREFNAEDNHKTKLFLISTRAGSLGLNMTAANRVIILDTSWNPAHDIQSIFRVYRFGQKKDCYIYRLVALGTMEQKIYERSVTKQAVACRVVDEQQIDRHYNMQELTELYRFDESGSGVESGVAPGVRDVVLLRVARLRALHAVHEHDSLLRGSEPALPEHERQAAWSQFQQEHENGQLEDNKKVKKIAVKRTYNRAAPATAVKPEQGADDSQDFKPKEPKPKRGRKNTSHVEQEGESILPDPDTERIDTLDPDTEQSMVKKITELLVRYNFSYKDAQSALPQLVMNVRRLVQSGQNFDHCDDLIAGIARVLMPRQDNMSMPLVNGIIGESVNQTIAVNKQMGTMEMPAKTNEPPPAKPQSKTKVGRPRKNIAGPKCKKGYVYEEVPSTSTAPSNVPLFDRLLLPNDTDCRTKRKAAIAAERLLDTAVEDGVIDIDDDDDYDTDSAPEAKEAENGAEKVEKAPVKVVEMTQLKPKSSEVKPNITITQHPSTKEPKAYKSKTKKPTDDSMEVLEDVMDTSILLSDDEERVLTKTAMDLEPEGEISVHPSLLKNNNFIKIVAHTYLAGNPMLDEDAALLAARYSTYKAVKELETTGKPITSGPIYDIAVQVLGKPILKKLHNTNHKVDTEDDAQASLLLDILSGSMGKKDQANTSKPPEQSSNSTTKADKSKGKMIAPAKETTKPGPSRARKVYKESSDEESDTPIIANDSPQDIAPTPKKTNLDKMTAQKKPGPRRPRKVYKESSDEESDTTIIADDSPQNSAPKNKQSYLDKVMSQNGVARPRAGPAEAASEGVAAYVAPQGYPTPAHPQGYPTPALPQGVVPVGLFKTTVTVAQPSPARRDSADECILPDDDDIRIVSDPPPPPASLPTSQIPAPSLVPLTKLMSSGATPRRNSQPLVLKMVRAAPAPAPPAGDAICLDSDDEDTPLVPAHATPPAPILTATGIVTTNYSPIPPKPTVNYPHVASKPTTAAKPIKLKLAKVDPSKFILTAKNKQVQAPPPVVENKESPVRYIMIPKSQVGQMYPPLVPISATQMSPNHIVQANPDGTYTLHSKPQIIPASSTVIPLAPEANPPSKTDVTSTSTSTGGKKQKITVKTPVSTPTISIDSGLVQMLTVKSNEEIVPTSVRKATPVKAAAAERQSTPAQPVAAATPATPAKAAARARQVSSSDSDSPDSGGDEDPLSILKDVVHIQADSYEARAPAKAAGPKKVQDTSTKPTVSAQKDSASNKTGNTGPAKVQMQKDTLSQFTISTTGAKKTQTITKTNPAPSAPKASTSSRTFFDSVDLTFFDDEPTPVEQTAKKAPNLLSKTQPAVTKPSAGKTVLLPAKVKTAAVKASTATPIKTSQPSSKGGQISASKTVQQSTSKTRPTILNKVSSNPPPAKKRAAPVETAPPKKKKADHVMTLKDFNIDDIDDIIELD